MRVSLIRPRGGLPRRYQMKLSDLSEQLEKAKVVANGAHGLGGVVPLERSSGSSFLVSESSTFVTGTPFFVDGSFMVRK